MVVGGVVLAPQGELDVVCGFQLIDDDCRTIVIEGRGDSGLAKVMAQVPRVKRNDEGYRVLYHPKVRPQPPPPPPLPAKLMARSGGCGHHGT